jgi:hypothetical protein
MSITYNSRIVRDGLVLHLDAANVKSYSGSGTLWKDLSGNGKHGTLVNGVGFSSDNKGAMVLDRINDHVLLSNSYNQPSLPIGNSSRTLITCFRTANTLGTAPYEHVMHYGSASGDAAYGVALIRINSQSWIANHTWGGTSYMSDYSLQPNTIYWTAVSYNNTASPRNSFFVNGEFGSVSFGQGKGADYAINTGTGWQLFLGTRISPAEYFGGQIFLAQVYNRALTAAEIRQNFEATRGRYGI